MTISAGDLLQLADVRAAARRIAGDVLRTPLLGMGPDLPDLRLKA